MLQRYVLLFTRSTLLGVELTLSDVEVATRGEDRLFGAGNLGSDAIATFTRNHKCSGFCRLLGLREIRAVNVDSEVQNSLYELGSLM